MRYGLRKSYGNKPGLKQQIEWFYPARIETPTADIQTARPYQGRLKTNQTGVILDLKPASGKTRYLRE